MSAPEKRPVLGTGYKIFALIVIASIITAFVFM